MGHTGDIDATIVACKAADEAVKVSTNSGVATLSPSIPSTTNRLSIELTLSIPVIIMFKNPNHLSIMVILNVSKSFCYCFSSLFAKLMYLLAIIRLKLYTSAA